MTGRTQEELLVVLEAVSEDEDEPVRTTDVSHVTVTVTSLEIVAGLEPAGHDLGPGHGHAGDPVPVDHARAAVRDLAHVPALVPSLDRVPDLRTARGGPGPVTKREGPGTGDPAPKTGRVNVVDLDQNPAPSLVIESRSQDLVLVTESLGLSPAIGSPQNDALNPEKAKVQSQDRGPDQSPDPNREKGVLSGTT